MTGRIICQKCMAEIGEGYGVCPYCGALTVTPPSKTEHEAAFQIPGQGLPNVLEWNFNISFFNRFIVMTVLKAIGISIIVAVAIVLAIIISDPSPPAMIIWDAGWLYALGLVGIVVIGVIITLIVVYGNRYEVRFRVDNLGASYRPRSKTRKKNAALIILGLIFGLYRGSPLLVGSSILTASRQDDSMGWKEVRELKFYPKQHVIMLKSRMRRFFIYCRPENYETVSRMCLYFYDQVRS